MHLPSEQCILGGMWFCLKKKNNKWGKKGSVVKVMGLYIRWYRTGEGFYRPESASMAGDRKGGLGLAISRSNLAACALGGRVAARSTCLCFVSHKSAWTSCCDRWNLKKVTIPKFLTATLSFGTFSLADVADIGWMIRIGNLEGKEHFHIRKAKLRTLFMVGSWGRTRRRRLSTCTLRDALDTSYFHTGKQMAISRVRAASFYSFCFDDRVQILALL